MKEKIIYTLFGSIIGLTVGSALMKRKMKKSLNNISKEVVAKMIIKDNENGTSDVFFAMDTNRLSDNIEDGIYAIEVINKGKIIN